MRCVKTKLVSDYTYLSCEFGSIQNISGYGVFEIGSQAENEGICDLSMLEPSKSGLSCSSVSDKNHALGEDLKK